MAGRGAGSSTAANNSLRIDGGPPPPPPPTRCCRYGPRGSEDVKGHAFFKSINWSDVRDKLLVPPFRPGLCINTPAFIENYDLHLHSTGAAPITPPLPPLPLPPPQHRRRHHCYRGTAIAATAASTTIITATTMKPLTATQSFLFLSHLRSSWRRPEW
jgi:hypothetical protein